MEGHAVLLMKPLNAICVGLYQQRFNDLTGQVLPRTEIYQSKGLVKHVKTHHPSEIANLALIPQIIKSPDYVGHHPKEPNSVELVKVYQGNVMVCVKLDAANGYLYVASVYEVSQSKLLNRINSGRLKSY